MTMRVTKKGNLVVDGGKYKAKRAYDGCRGCAFTDGCGDMNYVPPCTQDDREGKGYPLPISVIFVKKEKKQDETTS